MNVILPIGSVVKLRNSDKLVMIFGYFQKSTTLPDKVVDYVGVAYPLGNVNIFTQYGFQMTDIEQVIFEGYRNEEFKSVEMLLELRQKAHEEGKIS